MDWLLIALKEPLQSCWREVLHSAVVAEVIADRAAMILDAERAEGGEKAVQWYLR